MYIYTKHIYNKDQINEIDDVYWSNIIVLYYSSKALIL